MPAISAQEPVSVIAARLASFSTPAVAEGNEGRFVFGNRQMVYRAWYDRSEFLSESKERSSDDLPPVYQSPIVRTVATRFYDDGPHLPLPFPDSD